MQLVPAAIFTEVMILRASEQLTVFSYSTPKKLLLERNWLSLAQVT